MGYQVVTYFGRDIQYIIPYWESMEKQNFFFGLLILAFFVVVVVRRNNLVTTYNICNQ